MSKENSSPAPALIKGKLLKIEPLAAQRPEDVLLFYKKNKDFFRPFSPTWPDGFFIESFWQRKIWASSQDWQNDLAYSFVLKDFNEKIIGNINLSQVCRGAFQNAYLGYGIDHDQQGKGQMTEAVHLIVKFAFEKLRLHRVQANTLVDNIPSQKVLLKNDFVEEGFAKNYFARINPHYDEK